MDATEITQDIPKKPTIIIYCKIPIIRVLEIFRVICVFK